MRLVRSAAPLVRLLLGALAACRPPAAEAPADQASTDQAPAGQASALCTGPLAGCLPDACPEAALALADAPGHPDPSAWGAALAPCDADDGRVEVLALRLLALGADAPPGPQPAEVGWRYRSEGGGRWHADGTLTDPRHLSRLRSAWEGADAAGETSARTGLLVWRAHRRVADQLRDPTERALALTQGLEWAPESFDRAAFARDLEAQAQALEEVDPAGAVSLWELLALRRSPALPDDAELLQRAAAGARRAMFPVYEQSLLRRYRNRRWAGDREAGLVAPLPDPPPPRRLLDGQDEVAGFLLHLPAAPTADHRIRALATWFYGWVERVCPEPVPDLLRLADRCQEDRTAACTLTSRELVTWAWELDGLEATWADLAGVPLVWDDRP
jgi:hypothetical protein